MKLLHLSDLHLGKRFYDYSLYEDQKYILDKILTIAEKEKTSGVIIAGDVYDKNIPPADAVQLFDDFLVSLARLGQQVFIISGNHDSPERLSFGGRLIDMSGVHIAPVYDGNIAHHALSDGNTEVDVFMLPFIKPIMVRHFFPDTEINTYTDAVRTALVSADTDNSKVNILVAHQFVTGASKSGSEDVMVGGLDNVDASVFDKFDYVALGHLHNVQNIGSDRIRYCGTPLKYSLSESDVPRTVTLLDIRSKGDIKAEAVPLRPLHEVVRLKGSYEELTARSFYGNTSYSTDYVHITLTDENDIPDAVAKLRVIYRNLLAIEYDNTRTKHSTNVDSSLCSEELTPTEIFNRLYEMQNGRPMTKEQTEYIEELFAQIAKEEV